MRTVRTKQKSGERGTQIAELAMVLPLLMFLTLIVSEGAGFVRVHQVLNNAARESARLSGLPQNHGNTAFLQNTATCYLIRNKVIPPAGQVPAACSVAVANPTCSTYSVTVNQGIIIPSGIPGVSSTASQVVVTCGYQLKYLPKFPWFGVSGTFSTGRVNLGGSAEFRNFY
jgi:hypothetical protein